MLFAAASLLLGAALPAQTAPQRQVVAATSSPSDSVAVIRANALLEELVRADELVLRSAQPDRSLPGRVHEYFAQVHRGVPVRGAGLARQSADGVPVSVFGTTFADIDIDTDPGLDAEAALARMEALTGAARATTEPAELVIVPTMLGELVLAWSAPLQDIRTWFLDAHHGELVHRIDHFFTEAAVGSGTGITGELRKMSTWSTEEGRYEARDRLRPAEIVTMDAGGNVDRLFEVVFSLREEIWLSLVASDDYNAWANPGVVDGHANLGVTYDYLFKNRNWRGFDGHDGRIYSLVNLGFFNALFVSAPFGPEATGLLGFGETPDDIPLVPLDIVAHELMHGVTFSALNDRTGQGLHGESMISGPSTIRVGDDVIRCGDAHSFGDGFPEGTVGTYLCFDEDGNRTTSRSGRFGLFLDDSGAINEAYSDIIGTAVEFWAHPPGEGALRADYLTGEDSGVTTRRIDRPGSLPIGEVHAYPDAVGQEFRFVAAEVRFSGGGRVVEYTRFGMKDDQWFNLGNDGYTGLHWNSTILSHAYYLAIEGGPHSSGQTVDGVGVANRGQIEEAFFRALVDLAPVRVTFPTMGRLIRQAAMDLHGAGSAPFTAIDQGLTAVGL